MNDIISNIPDSIRNTVVSIADRFSGAGFQCYLVGGSVRDLLLGIECYDYDFATNARPEQITRLFKRVAPTGIKHGTVSILQDGSSYEVTTYRSDGNYADGRRPDTVSFSDSLEVDVSRRDFTINGLAYDVLKSEIIDHVGGMDDLRSGIIRTIGNPAERFNEDGLRPYRACRFASKLNFKIEDETFKAISGALDVSRRVSAERVRDELNKLLTTEKPSRGLEYMRRSGLMEIFLPELYHAYEVGQNRFHIYDIYHHSVYSCDAAPKDNPLIRLAALLHDIGKVPTRRQGPDGEATFYNHEVVGAKMVKKIMRCLKYSNDEVEKVVNLVFNHMFHYTDEWTDGAVRRFMRKVGVENLDELFQLRLADRKGNGSREGMPFPILKLQQRIGRAIDEANAITVRDLNINGNEIMELFGLKPGPVIGKVLHELLELVLDDPSVNVNETLISEASRIIREYSSDDN